MQPDARISQGQDYQSIGYLGEAEVLRLVPEGHSRAPLSETGWLY